ncbi:DeoR/GlpR family DNA-binding transcription regulator [Amycolatopsis alkalitolerans]|uniref:DeoR/GlpR family DNA-binding transcription regulator n=1 Tax=Amycolatopsis alkalitolerans TaxID=2547244 RepID=UPI001F215391|nr:DeoR/GlpR family DNA-binding transcription regulator [Amycolatopsis alkalitolerans]
MAHPDARPSGKRSGDGLTRQQRRQRQIAEAVIDGGSIRIEDLAERFDVSVMTVHRDLDELEAHGLLRKTRGQATALASSLFESNARFRLGQQRAEKEALAQAALNLLEPGYSVFMDDSTTGVYLARLLPQRTPLTVITNFRGVIDELTDVPAITVFGLGGQYFAWCDAFMGDMTVAAIRNLRADIFVMSTSAITDGVCFHQHQDTVTFKRAMFDSAAQRILYVDHTKFGRRALHALLPLSEFDVVIVDRAAPADEMARLADLGVTVITAEPVDSVEATQ